MEWGILVPIVAIAIGPLAWVLNNWIRARHGYAPEATEESMSKKRTRLLTQENERLTAEVEQLHSRIAVLERIVTDPADRTAREIESLR